MKISDIVSTDKDAALQDEAQKLFVQVDRDASGWLERDEVRGPRNRAWDHSMVVNRLSVLVSGWFRSRPYNISGGFRRFQGISGSAVNGHVLHT